MLKYIYCNFILDKKSLEYLEYKYKKARRKQKQIELELACQKTIVSYIAYLKSINK